VPLGAGRILLGWLTLGFLILGFTLRPIDLVPGMEKEQHSPAQQKQEPERNNAGDGVEVQALPSTPRHARGFLTACDVESCENLVRIAPRNRELGQT
jgi:hypothetical protein